MQIFASVIIGRYQQRREATEKRETLLDTECFVCGLKKKEAKDIFEEHITDIHNMWNYFYFADYLKHANNKKMKEFEKETKEKVLADELNWIPIIKQ